MLAFLVHILFRRKTPSVGSRRCVVAIVASLFSCQVARCFDDSSADGDFFKQKVQPIFISKCYACHSDKVQKSAYRLDAREIAMAGGEFGEAAIVAGKSAESPLLRYVSAKSEERMPPADSKFDALTGDEVEILRKWIDDGAYWPASASVKLNDPLNWWSFRSLQKPPVPRDVSGLSLSAVIDYFVDAKLTERGLKRSPPADARTLARRLYFDLIGLPPTPESLDEFERKYGVDHQAAIDELVEHLLASPLYGERWARHWLDVVHYGDTHGFDKDKPRPNAWPYRDYVIRSLNADKLYVQFVREQIAGDVLWPKTRDGIEGLGFIAAGPWDFIGHAEVAESKIDGKIARHLDRDDMISNTIGTFCSVTIHCAQCHQHKFDPITQEDYYSLQAVFAALDRTDIKYYRDEAIAREASDLSRQHTALASQLEALEGPLKKAAGDEYQSLTERIAIASQPTKSLAPKPEFGYHSAISTNATDTKWVQVDLGTITNFRRVRLLPCYDDFNSIGAGFGFPVRFKVEASNDADFKNDVHRLVNEASDTLSSDFKNPGLQAFEADAEAGDGVSCRYVRVTATKLAPRQNDFIFALAELQVFDAAGTNIALAKTVAAVDTIEAPPRWRRSNLTDNIFPDAATTGEDKSKLILAREQLLDSFADDATKKQRRKLKQEIEAIDGKLKSLPAPDLVYAAGIHHGSGTFVGTGASGGRPRPIHLLARGQVTMPGREMVPGALAAFNFRPARFAIPADAPEGQRRVALAEWITDANNPLTWRSIVNRVWQYHFGRGIVDTPNDLGHNGGAPSHVELLDWLAFEFRDSGGSLKDLHRMILKSETYRQSSTHTSPNSATAQQIDSANSLLWRQNRRRLEAEAIRDSVLAVSGNLDLKMGGPGWQDFVVEHPEHSPHYEYGLADPEDKATWRRSIYRFIVRSQTQPWMTSLDCADPSMRVDKRNESLSAIQALALLNNGFMLSQSQHFAERVRREVQNQQTHEQDSQLIAAQVDRAYRLAIGTAPSDSEREALIQFAQQHGLPYLCRLLLNLNAFTFVD